MRLELKMAQEYFVDFELEDDITWMNLIYGAIRIERCGITYVRWNVYQNHISGN